MYRYTPKKRKPVGEILLCLLLAIQFFFLALRGSGLVGWPIAWVLSPVILLVVLTVVSLVAVFIYFFIKSGN